MSAKRSKLEGKKGGSKDPAFAVFRLGCAVNIILPKNWTVV